MLLGEAGEATALAVEALEGDEMPVFDRGTFTCLPAAVLAMNDPAEAEHEWQRIRALGGAARVGARRDRRRPLGRPGARSGWATCVRATELLERAMEGETLFGSAGNAHMAYSSAFLALAWLERGDVERAWEALRGRGDQSGAVRRRALLDDQPRRAAAGRRALRRGAAPITDALAATRPPETHPLWSPWRSLRARAAAGEGDRQTASRLAGEELELARRAAAPWVVGRALRQYGELTGDRGRAARKR